MKRLSTLAFVVVGVLFLTTSVVSAATTTNPPSNLVITTVSGQCKQLKLTWNDNSSVETNFRVERAPDVAGSPGTFVQIATVAGGSGSTKTYTDTTVDDDTIFWYRVRWFLTTGSRFSTYSNNASGNTGIVCAPSGLTVSALISTCEKLNLSWVNNSNVDDEIRIERATGTCTGTFVQIAVVPATSTTYQDTGLAGGTQYSYRVRAFNNADSKFSAYSPCVSGTTTGCGNTL